MPVASVLAAVVAAVSAAVVAVGVEVLPQPARVAAISSAADVLKTDLLISRSSIVCYSIRISMLPR
jgi:hypothetical protein